MAATRIKSLDVIRGFALIGVLAVNAAYFAAPLASVANPLAGPLSVAGGNAWAWAVPYILFEYKSIALFSMLFGASLVLVGGDHGDPVGDRRLRRRLGWLALFGILHGTLLWFGDILLSYSLAGLLVARARSWNTRRLTTVGLVLFATSLVLIGAMAAMIARMSPSELATFSVQNWSPTTARLSEETAGYRLGLNSAFLANLGTWVDFQIQTLLLLTPRTAGLMMIGIALLRDGFLAGRADQARYWRWLALGAVALAVLTWNGWDMARQGFPLVRVQALGTMLTASLAPLVALGYAAALILLLRARIARFAMRTLAAVGRTAFTNYLVQSIVMTTLFWGGRGLGLYGSVSRPVLMGIAASLFLAQAFASVLWLRRFSHGPFEAAWRRLARVVRSPTRSASIGAVLAIETIGLDKAFGDRAAVAQLDLRVPAGAIYAFLGANGAGKTTTIRILLGLTRPSAGSARIFGHDVVGDRTAAAGQVGALLEARATYDHLTGRANLEITRRLLNIPKGEVDRVLGVVGMTAAADRRVGHYSLGMRQRLGLARALLGNPRLLLLDEPMNGLDPEGIVEMRETIRSLPHSTGATVFLSSHLLDEVQQVATHVGLMRAGRLVVQGPLDDLVGSIPARLHVRTGDDRRAAVALRGAGLQVEAKNDALSVAANAAAASRVAELVLGAGVSLAELTPGRPDLETLYRRWSLQEAA